jgi:hypothetical protein
MSKPRLEVLLIIKNFKLAIRGQSHFVECSSDVTLNRLNYEFSFWEFHKKKFYFTCCWFELATRGRAIT